MQVFQKNEGSILCGAGEVIELLKIGTGYFKDPPLKVRGGKGGVMKHWIDKFNEIKIESLKDGDKLSAGETVMHITGPYAYFAHLESLYLGILARRTLVASNTGKAVEAANGKPVLFFADRFDYFLNQEGDGYAAHIGGTTGVCTEAMASRFGGEAGGTIPHSLIAVYNGETVKAAMLFDKYYGKTSPYPSPINLIALVDFDNDCVKTSLEAARKLGNKLWGVRIDTAANMIDKSLSPRHPAPDAGSRQERALYGVNPTLVKLVRKALDHEGFDEVKIVVSGGFDAERIVLFEKEKAPVDVYGAGSALLKGNNDFTADIVMVDGKPMAKAGRKYQKNSRLKVIKLNHR